MTNVDTDDIVSVSTLSNVNHQVTLWTVEGDPVTVGTFSTLEVAEMVAGRIADAVRSWMR